MPATSNHLDASLVDRLLVRLGLGRPALDLVGLGDFYRAWCLGVPFDNVRKMTAMFSGAEGPLPGSGARDFLESWLEHGTGGTCWSGSNALFALVEALGFEARRIACSMRDTGYASHGSVKVRIDGVDWLLDSSMLTMVPLAMTGIGEVVEDPVFPMEVEVEDGTHVIWWDVPPSPTPVPCRVLHDAVDHDFHLRGYEASRHRGAFNHRLYARRNLPGEMVLVIGNTRISRTAAGTVSRDISRGELRAVMRGEFGFSAAVCDGWERAGCLEPTMQPPTTAPVAAPTRLPPSRRGG